MSYKLLEQNGIDNENVDGGAFNRFAAGSRDGIIQGVLSECELMSIGNGIGIYPGLILLCGMRFKITEMESLFVSSVPAVPTQYQIIVEVTLSEDRGVTPNIYLRAPAVLKQDYLYRTEKGVYQVELGSFVHNPDGTITNLLRTLDVITGGSAGGGSGTIEVGNITTETLSPGLKAEFDVTMRKDAESQKDLLDFHAAIPQGKGVQGAEVSYKASESGIDIPDEEGWSTSIPDVKGGEYLWTRVVINYSDGANTTFYSVSKFSSDNALLPSDSKPKMDGVGSAGSASKYSREDHVHPSDAKNLYNLGAFDTHVSNGDGTGAVARKTGYIALNGDMFSTNGYADNQHWTDIIAIAIKKPANNNTVARIKTSNPSLIISPYYNKGSDYMIGVSDGGRLMIYYSGNDFNAFIEGTVIQFEAAEEYQYTEKVIDNTPIHTANQEEEFYWSEEWKKGINLWKNNYAFAKTSFPLVNGNFLAYLYVWKQGFTELLGGNSVSSGNEVGGSVAIPEDGIYTVQIENHLVSPTDRQTLNIYFKAGKYQFFADINTNGGTLNYSNFMLTRGSRRYPYEPYHGGFVREGSEIAQWVDDEWRKGLNLIEDTLLRNSTNRLYIPNTYIPNGTYTLSIPSFPTGFNVAIRVSGSKQSGYPNNELYDSGWLTGTEWTRNLPDGYIGIVFRKTNESDINISDLENIKVMLNAGNHPYPYEPYHGEIVREKDLPVIVLNGEPTNTPSFYAPTIAGTEGYLLLSKKVDGNSPDWVKHGSYNNAEVTYISETKVADYVKEYFREVGGTFWYRKWASGWKECGGRKTNDGKGTADITFANGFKFDSVNYTLNVTCKRTSTGTTATQIKELGYVTKTINGFTRYESTNTSHEAGFDYYACGY